MDLPLCEIMNILITGSTGFIGTHLTSIFVKKYKLFTPKRSQLDLLDEKKLQTYFLKNSIDIIIHCAAVGGYGPHLYVEGMCYDNLRMFFNLVRCKKYYKRMINIGSGAAYDKRVPIIKIKESDFGKHIPNDEYGLYKYICSDYINQIDNIVDLRVFGLFGEGEDYRYRFISNAICRHIFNLPITIKQNVYFDYLYMQDFLKIMEYFIQHKPKHKAYNIGNDKACNLISLANIINTVGGRKEKIIVGKKRYANEYSCNTDRLYSEIKPISLTPIRESITRLYSLYQSHRADIDPSIL